LKSVTEAGSGFDLVTIDVDSHPELAAEYKVCRSAVQALERSCERRRERHWDNGAGS
jgi:hypothetical protein